MVNILDVGMVIKLLEQPDNIFTLLLINHLHRILKVNSLSTPLTMGLYVSSIFPSIFSCLNTV